MSESGEQPDDDGPKYVFHGGIPIPLEVHEQLEQQKANVHELREQNVRAQDEFIESMDEDKLRMFRGFVGGIIDDPSYGNYMLGWISSILKIKYNVCRLCGDKHLSLEDLTSAHPEQS